MKERIGWADRARGLGILLVFHIHFFHNELHNAHLLVQLLGISCLTAFYFTSGYFCSGRFAWKGWLKHNVRTLLVPYLAASGISWLIGVAQGDPKTLDRLLGILLQFPGTPWEGTRWFVPCFFVAKLIFAFTASRCKDRATMLFGICLGYAGIAWVYTLLNGPRLPWNVEAALLAQPFFAMGYGWRQGLEQHCAALSTSQKAAGLALACAGFLGLGLLNLKLGGAAVDYHIRSLNEFFTAYGASACSLVLILGLSRFENRFLVFLGRNSFIYYLYGGLVAAVTSRIITALLGWEYPVSRYLGGPVGMILLGAPLAVALNRFCPWAAGKQTAGK